MGHLIAKPTVIVNNSAFGIVPSSLRYTEGFGEYGRVAAVSGNSVDPIFFENGETQYSKVMFAMYPTTNMVDTIRDWKNAKDSNLIELSFEDPSTGEIFSRTFTNASLDNDYEVSMGVDGTIELEWTARAAS